MDGPCQAIAAALTDLRMRHQQAQALLGWAMKRDPPNFALLAAVDAILDARPIRRYVPPATADLPEWLHDKRAVKGALRQRTIPREGEWVPTPMQRDILRHLAEGDMDAEVGAKVGLTKLAVRRHVAKMCPLADVTNRVALAVEAHRRGYIE